MIDASVLVVGAGAIGGVTAANLEGEVRRVSVLDADKEHVERMRDPGLLLDELGEERYVRLDAHADPSDFEDPFDFALVTLKAPHLEAGLGPLVERGLARTFVSLGNGLVQDRIAAIVGDENLIVGTVEWGATNLGVVERGREYGVETPLNARVVELMHTMERGERRPGRDALEELQALAG
jgi:2-dehydropantoate 2-reductase